MALPNLTKETAADAVIGMGTWISLHTGDPGTTGADEATGGSYARQQTTWSADTTDDGVRAGTQVTIDVAAGTYNHFGIWSGASGGTFVGGAAVTSTTLGSAGQIKVNPSVTSA